jgi:hypothetical protein
MAQTWYTRSFHRLHPAGVINNPQAANTPLSLAGEERHPRPGLEAPPGVQLFILPVFGARDSRGQLQAPVGELVNFDPLSGCPSADTPALVAAGWEHRQFREEVKLTDGRVVVRGKLASRLQNQIENHPGINPALGEGWKKKPGESAS